MFKLNVDDSEVRLHVEKLEAEIKQLSGAFFYNNLYHGKSIALKQKKKDLLEYVEEKLLQQKISNKNEFKEYISKYYLRLPHDNKRAEAFEYVLEGQTKIVLDNIFKGLNGSETYWKPYVFTSLCLFSTPRVSG